MEIKDIKSFVTSILANDNAYLSIAGAQDKFVAIFQDQSSYW